MPARSPLALKRCAPLAIVIDMAVPKEVAAVRDAMQSNAERGGLSPHIAKKVVYCQQEPNGTWQLCDNFERYSDLILEYDSDGQWTTRRMSSDARPKKITFGEALANANLFFADA